MILSEAFKQLDMLTEETFSLDKDGLEELKDFEEKDEVTETEDIIDPKAESEEELEDSYVGKVILDCCVCHSKLYKDAEEVVLSEDETIANADEECPFCYSTDGFKVIGQVSEFEEESAEEEPETEETIEVEEENKEETEEITEGIFGDKYKGKTILLYNNSPIAMADSKSMGNLVKFENAHMKKTGASESEYRVVNGRGAAKRIKGLKSVTDVTKSLPHWVIQSGEEDVKKRARQQRQEDARQAAERNEVSRKLAAYDASKRRVRDNGGTGGNTGKAGIYYSGGDYYSESLDEGIFDKFKKDKTLYTIWQEKDGFAHPVRYNVEGEKEAKKSAGQHMEGHSDSYIKKHNIKYFSKPQDKEAEKKAMDDYHKRIEDAEDSDAKPDTKPKNADASKSSSTDAESSVAKHRQSSKGGSRELSSDTYKKSQLKGTRPGNANIGNEGDKYVGRSTAEQDSAPNVDTQDTPKKRKDRKTQAAFSRTHDEKGMKKDRAHAISQTKDSANESLKESIDDIKKIKKFIQSRVTGRSSGMGQDSAYFAKWLAEAEPSIPSLDFEKIAEVAYSMGYDVYKTSRGYFDDEDYLIVYPGKDPSIYLSDLDDDERAEYTYMLDDLVKVESFKGRSIKESINNLSLDTEDTHMEMTSEENGKVTITTEPLNNTPAEGEFIAPLEDETKMEIEANSDEEPVGEEEVSTEIGEFDEESFNELGESYLKKVYDNVQSFKTTSVGATPKKLVVEGLIKFSSGKSKKTSFIFESKTITKSGKVKFIGENKEITPRKNAFVVKGQLKGTKLLSESLTYNYRAKDSKGKSSRLYGTVKVGK
jgi:hypothetical protein